MSWENQYSSIIHKGSYSWRNTDNISSINGSTKMLILSCDHVAIKQYHSCHPSIPDIVLHIDRNIWPISSTYRSVSVNKGFYISKYPARLVVFENAWCSCESSGATLLSKMASKMVAIKTVIYYNCQYKKKLHFSVNLVIVNV